MNPIQLKNPSSEFTCVQLLARSCSVLLVGFLLLGGMGTGSAIQSQDATNPQSSETDGLPRWKNLTKKELAQRLKVYAYAKVRSSMKSPLEYKEEKIIFYTPCPEIFPKLEGDLPCNFLDWEEKSGSELDPSSNEYREGGEVNVYLSTRKSHLVNGISLLLSSQEKSEPNSSGKNGKKTYDIHPTDIQIYYNPDKKISHYRIGNKAILFLWKREDGVDTLKSILELNLNSALYADSGREIDFSK